MPRVHPPHPVPLTSLLLWGTFSSPFLPFRLTLASLTLSPSHHVTLSFFVIFFVQIIASEFSVDVDEDTLMAKDPLPKCNKCGSSLLRPNILMFGDMSWLEERYHPLSLLITSPTPHTLIPELCFSSPLRLLASSPPRYNSSNLFLVQSSGAEGKVLLIILHFMFHSLVLFFPPHSLSLVFYISSSSPSAPPSPPPPPPLLLHSKLE